MSENRPLREGQVLTGPLFNEPMRVETLRGPEFDLYRDVTRFLKHQSARAAARDDPRARAVDGLGHVIHEETPPYGGGS